MLKLSTMSHSTPRLTLTYFLVSPIVSSLHNISLPTREEQPFLRIASSKYVLHKHSLHKGGPYQTILPKQGKTGPYAHIHKHNCFRQLHTPTVTPSSDSSTGRGPINNNNSPTIANCLLPPPLIISRFGGRCVQQRQMPPPSWRNIERPFTYETKRSATELNTQLMNCDLQDLRSP